MLPRAVGVGVLVVAACLLSVAAASADPLGFGGCFHAHGKYRCDPLEHGTLDGSRGVAVSPDGESVYATANGSQVLTAFDRAPDGSLTNTACIANATHHGCVAADH